VIGGDLNAVIRARIVGNLLIHRRSLTNLVRRQVAADSGGHALPAHLQCELNASTLIVCAIFCYSLAANNRCCSACEGSPLVAHRLPVCFVL
jgi:hypothetical protein